MKKSITKSKTLIKLALTFFGILIFLNVIIFLIENESQKAKAEEIMNNEKYVVQMEYNSIENELSSVISDLFYLKDAYKSSLIKPEGSENYKVLLNDWVKFSMHKVFYDQIRYIDNNGYEKIRINYGNDGPVIVDTENLQNKSDRYYFTETIKLKENSVYISPLDLNVEMNAVEIPYKPMIRIATPVYDDANVLKGVIVLNFKAEQMLSIFREISKNSIGEIVLLNSNGYSLSSSNQNNDWNFMFEANKEKSFKSQNEDDWKIIANSEGQFKNNNKLITVSSIDLLPKNCTTVNVSHSW